MCSAGGERLLHVACEGKTIRQVQFLGEACRTTACVGTLLWISVPCSFHFFFLKKKRMITSTIEISFYACKNVCNMRMLFLGEEGGGKTLA